MLSAYMLQPQLGTLAEHFMALAACAMHYPSLVSVYAW